MSSARSNIVISEDFDSVSIKVKNSIRVFALGVLLPMVVCIGGLGFFAPQSTNPTLAWLITGLIALVTLLAYGVLFLPVDAFQQLSFSKILITNHQIKVPGATYLMEDIQSVQVVRFGILQRMKIITTKGEFLVPINIPVGEETPLTEFLNEMVNQKQNQSTGDGDEQSARASLSKLQRKLESQV